MYGYYKIVYYLVVSVEAALQSFGLLLGHFSQLHLHHP
jgi:hypothetical protein